MVPSADVWSITAATERGAKVRKENRCPYCENEKEIKEHVRREEERRQQLEADACWANDETFCDRALASMHLRLIAISPEYFQESGQILDELRERERATRVWLTSRLATLALKFEGLDDELESE
jgi:hypothetical protein